MTSTITQIMQHNRELEMRYPDVFRSIFRLELHDYMNYLTGFDIVKFDEAVKTPDGISTREWIQTQYGAEAINLIRKLI